jgi:hypothetical protein
MDVHFAGQMKELSETLEETRKTAKSTDAAYRKALESHSDQVAEQLGVYAGSFGQTAASFETLQGSVDGLLTLTAPLLRQVIAHQEALLKAIEDETTASKVIGRAASELSAAAQASRETVGQFITLAERLREANKAAGGGNAGGGSDKRVVQALRALRSGFGETDEAS